jgi:hypothetical protein
VKRNPLATESRGVPLLHLEESYAIRPVEVDFGGPALQVLECLRCHTVWRIHRDRAGNWPRSWWHCPNGPKHPPGADPPTRLPRAARSATRSDLPSIGGLQAEQLLTLRRAIDARLEEVRSEFFEPQRLD